ncbi:undecaprenyl-phosphate glucose phosphotransferase [Rhodospirillum centenum]|uniref:Colanic biosynthesis UDP-glucose lipid carrier transferase, putative n=1 Tax=Rhodospirillum centenum (strain ATCC 51521 / SW) TaxID=414684 RepID=B6IYG9_RHOCS|nr:colanic biosynthesis UDP-glucose lipid carrier transferase, putative [Rhodospirillum centenum SW]
MTTAAPEKSSHSAVRRPSRWSKRAVQVVFQSSDLTIIIAAALAAVSLRFGQSELPDDYAVLVALGAFAFLFLGPMFRTHRPESMSDPVTAVRRVASSWGLAVLLVIALSFAAKTSGQYSRIWLGSWALLGFVALGSVRLFYRYVLTWLRETGRLCGHSVLVGPTDRIEALLPYLSDRENAVLATVAVAPRGSGDGGDGAAPAAPDLRDAVREIAVLCTRYRIDQVLLAPPLDDDAALEAYVGATRFLPVAVKILPPPGVLRRRSDFGLTDDPAVITVARPPLAEMDRTVKRLFDIVVGSALLVVLSPLLLLLAALIRLDSPGPALFRQRRGGFGKASFTVLKFRTLHVTEDGTGPLQQVTRRDPRVTRMGRFLRASSLDELPQLINVLRGEMSLVGPRPHALVHDTAFSEQVESYMARHRVKPGMTGLAQVTGLRGEVPDVETLQRRIEQDLYYVENWSLALDIKILVLTAIKLAGRDVY